MIRLLLACAVLLGLVPALPAPAAWLPADERFTLGVLRRDGVVIPFAAFDRRSWSTPWPMTVRDLDLPISLDDVPDRWWGRGGRPAEMTAWADGRNLGPVALSKPATIPIMCTGRMGLRTEYKSKEVPPPPVVQPFPKDGLVISGDATIQALPAVARSSSDWVNGALVILDEFNRTENLAIGQFADWRHPVSRGARARLPIQLEALYRAPMDEEGWIAYYVEAIRKYTPGPLDEGCGLVTFTSGWVRLPPKGKPLFDLSSRITYCDRKGAGYMLPLGMMTLDAKTFWIYQLSGYDREWYVVARPTPRAIELHVDYQAGTCPS
jgi:hypothetical protein